MLSEAEEIYEGLQSWVKKRRDEYGFNTCERVALDDLLDEIREAGAEGYLPWQR